MIADMLGADIYNEAIGSSCLHCKRPDRIDTENNPYGFIGNFEAASRCLTNSLTEMSGSLTIITQISGHQIP